MSDLIDRQTALDALKEYEVVESDNFTRTDPITMMTVGTIANCIEAIVALPSAEPEPAERTAKVEKVTRVSSVIRTGRCGNCGYDVIDSYKYCPNCGAKLDWSQE